MEKIVIRAVQMPNQKRPDEMIRWFCAVFGFSSEQGESTIEEQILEKFADAAYRGNGLSSSELTFKQKIARSTVIYHLNRFIDAGIIVKKGRKYYLRATDMSTVMEEIEYDLDREMRKMINAAREFDRIMSRRRMLKAKTEW